MDRSGKDSIDPEDDRDGLARGESVREQGASEPQLLARLGELRDEFAEWLKQGARLFGAESKLFASSLLLIVILAVTAAFVLAGASVFLGGAAVLLLIVHGGMDPVIAMLIGTLALCAIAAGCLFRMRGLTRHLRFTESRRMLSRLAGGNAPDGDGGTS